MWVDFFIELGSILVVTILLSIVFFDKQPSKLIVQRAVARSEPQPIYYRRRY